MSVRKTFEDAWDAKFPGIPVPTNLTFLDDEGVSSLATALERSEGMIRKLEDELCRQQFIYDFVLQRLNISIAARRSSSPSRRGIAAGERQKTPLSKSASGSPARGHGKTSQLAAVMAKFGIGMHGIGKVHRPAIDPDDEDKVGSLSDSTKKATPLSRFYDKSNMYRASSEPSLLDSGVKFKPQPAIPPTTTSRLPPGFKPIFTKDEPSKPSHSWSTLKKRDTDTDTGTLLKSHDKRDNPDSERCVVAARKSVPELGYQSHQRSLEDTMTRDETYLATEETNLDSVIPPTLTPLAEAVDGFEYDDAGDVKEHSHIYEELIELRRGITSTVMENENDDETESSDEEPLYFNILRFKQQTLKLANAVYADGSNEVAASGSSDNEKDTSEKRRLRRMAHHYQHIDPQISMPLTIPADSDAGVLIDTTSHSTGSSDTVDVADSHADTVTADTTLSATDCTDSVRESPPPVRPRRRSMAMAIDRDMPPDDDDSESAAATSDEDDKRQTRHELIRSFLDGERAYVSLLGSMVQVSLM